MDANVFIYYVVIFLEIFLRALPWILGICVLLLIFLAWSYLLEWIDEHMSRRNSVKVRRRTSRKCHSTSSASRHCDGCDTTSSKCPLRKKYRHTRGKQKRNMDETE